MGIYRDLSRSPGVFRILLAQLTARFPFGMLSITVLLHIQLVYGNYTSAGIILAAESVGQAVSGPLTSRLMGRFGMRPVLTLTTFVCAGLLLAIALTRLPLPVIAILALLMGLATPPVTPAVRTIYPKLVPNRQVTALFSLAASASGSPLLEQDSPALVASIREGELVSVHLASRPDLYPNSLYQMVAAGEESSRLPELLERTADYFEQETYHWVDSLGAVIEPTAGRMTLGDEVIYDDGWKISDLKALRRDRIGFVFQAPYLIPFLDVTDNIALLPMLAGRPNGEARARARELLEALDVGHRARAEPSQLSGGEQQRVAIARALANQPPVILADEPTAPLDSERALAVIRILNRMAQQYNTAVIVVTHDEKIIPTFKRIYHIRDGVTHEEAGEGRTFD